MQELSKLDQVWYNSISTVEFSQRSDIAYSFYIMLHNMQAIQICKYSYTVGLFNNADSLSVLMLFIWISVKHPRYFSIPMKHWHYFMTQEIANDLLEIEQKMKNRNSALSRSDTFRGTNFQKCNAILNETGTFLVSWKCVYLHHMREDSRADTTVRSCLMVSWLVEYT